jgi:hypothetical protein
MLEIVKKSVRTSTPKNVRFSGKIVSATKEFAGNHVKIAIFREIPAEIGGISYLSAAGYALCPPVQVIIPSGAICSQRANRPSGVNAA